ncbi:Segregation and condensation protein A [bioreactor metagenome]|uniref:Segregation and condensation protein A n=1 Tax=bioreactor metagenome TaxID=1076179 RepID=A0A645EDR2_9ZZZZ
MYKIVLPNFEGPFDLLLYFIKRDELNIYDIPISKITFEFLNYIKLMTYFDIELAGEFIVMAANLMYIKTQMLLPKQVNENGIIEEDPRERLIRNMLEYMQFKDVAKKLSFRANENKFLIYRGNFDAELDQLNIKATYKNSTLYDLLKAYCNALNRKETKDDVHIVEMFNVTVEEKIAMIRTELINSKRFTFSQLIQGQTRQHIIVSFLAILELIKSGQIFITQNEPFDDFTISEKPNDNIENQTITFS